MQIGIIGATGWLGSALGSRSLSLGIVTPDRLVVTNRSAELAALSDVIVVSVRPEEATCGV